MRKRPELLLARSLAKRWNAKKAEVMADWCETYGLFGVAVALREGPSAECRAKIEALYDCLRVGKRVWKELPPNNHHFWQIGWLPGWKPTTDAEKCVQAAWEWHKNLGKGLAPDERITYLDTDSVVTEQARGMPLIMAQGMAEGIAQAMEEGIARLAKEIAEKGNREPLTLRERDEPFPWLTRKQKPNHSDLSRSERRKEASRKRRRQ